MEVLLLICPTAYFAAGGIGTVSHDCEPDGAQEAQ
jgi:hypothetical protein